MGYIIKNDAAIVVKIDAGEALPFNDDMSSADGIKHHPKERNSIIGTSGTKIAFSELNHNDQKEFIQTSSDILMVGDEKIKNLFQEFIK